MKTPEFRVTEEDVRFAAEIWPEFAHAGNEMGGLYTGATAAGSPEPAVTASRAAVETAQSDARAKHGDFVVGVAFALQSIAADELAKVRP